MQHTRDRQLAEIAAHQHGVFTLRQAADVGFTDHQREFRVRVGRWVVLFDRVYRVSGVPESWRGDLLAACWATRALAIASHRSAAELWGLPGGRRDLLEITSRRSRRPKIPGLVVHETKSLRTDDIQEVDGIPTTSVEQTLLGIAAITHLSTLESAVDRALKKELTTRVRLDEFVRCKGKRGRNGIGVLRALLDALDPLAGVPESMMETKLKRLLRRHGLPTPMFQYVIRHRGAFVARVDAAYPELRIAIEFDSYEHHTGKLALVRDTDRRNRLLRMGWSTVTFTAADIARDGGHAIEALRAALAFSAANP